jgi:hypothetical protein
VSFGPVLFLSALTLGDYLLWNWSLNANHDVLALISGLSLPPLAIASVWLLALGVIRLIGNSTRPAVREAPAGAANAARAARDPHAPPGERDAGEAAGGGQERPSTSASPSAPSSGKLAA